jgi:hypothetical protein
LDIQQVLDQWRTLLHKSQKIIQLVIPDTICRLNIRSFRNLAEDVLKVPDIIASNITLQLFLFHHDPYRVPYRPPPWNTKPKSRLMLFSDDEQRNYNEDIPIPDTAEWLKMSKSQQKQAK